MEKSKLIALTQGKFAIVDAEDYDWLMQWKWHLNNKYASRTPWKAKKIYMHRLILGIPENINIDHVNGDGLDNRRSNLRKATQAQNCMNVSRRIKNSSKYKGVHWLKNNKCWRARIQVNKKGIHIGCFDNEDDAATAYNMAALRYFREYARLNMIPYAA